jgi:hypothetical protein
MFDDTCLSELGYYGRPIVFKILNDIRSTSEVRYYLLDVLLLRLEERVFLICYVLSTSFRRNRSNLKVPSLA